MNRRFAVIRANHSYVNKIRFFCEPTRANRFARITPIRVCESPGHPSQWALMGLFGLCREDSIGGVLRGNTIRGNRPERF